MNANEDYLFAAINLSLFSLLKNFFSSDTWKLVELLSQGETFVFIVDLNKDEKLNQTNNYDICHHKVVPILEDQ